MPGPYRKPFEFQDSRTFDPAKAHAYLERMIRTKCEAEARIRREFQARWGRFMKCSACGARLDTWRSCAIGGTWQSECCDAPVIEASYAPPPRT